MKNVKNLQKLNKTLNNQQCDQRTDGPTNGPTNQQSDLKSRVHATKKCIHIFLKTRPCAQQHQLRAGGPGQYGSWVGAEAQI